MNNNLERTKELNYDKEKQNPENQIPENQRTYVKKLLQLLKQKGDD